MVSDGLMDGWMEFHTHTHTRGGTINTVYVLHFAIAAVDDRIDIAGPLDGIGTRFVLPILVAILLVTLAHTCCSIVPILYCCCITVVCVTVVVLVVAVSVCLSRSWKNGRSYSLTKIPVHRTWKRHHHQIF